MRKILKHLIGAIGSFGMANLQVLESMMLKLHSSPKFPPIFIVGPPRSGTTLIYQALLYRYRLAYFSNLTNRCANFPALVTRLTAPLLKSSNIQHFRSQYGEGDSWQSPSQGNRIWSRWFHGPQVYHDASALSESDKVEMWQTIACIESAFRSPFVNKSIGHSVRLSSLFRVFPNAIIIRIQRDRRQVVESILYGRRECFGNESHWFSVRPSNYDQIKNLSPVEQVCRQVLGVEHDIDRAIQKLHESQVYEMSYESFCESPREMLDAFADFYCKKSETELILRGEIPRCFSKSTRKKVSNEEQEAICEELTKIESSTTSSSFSA